MNVPPTTTMASRDWRQEYLVRVRALHSGGDAFQTVTNGFFQEWERAVKNPTALADALTRAQKARLGYGSDEDVYESAISGVPIHAQDVFVWKGYVFNVEELQMWIKQGSDTHPATREPITVDIRTRLFMPRKMIIHYYPSGNIRERYVIADGRVADYVSWNDLAGDIISSFSAPPSPPPARHRVVLEHYDSGYVRWWYEIVNNTRILNFIAWKDGAEAEVDVSAQPPALPKLPNLAIVYNDSIDIVESSTGMVVRRLRVPAEQIIGVAFSPDWKFVVCGFKDNSVRALDLISGAQLKQFDGHTDHVWGIAVSPDGKMIATGSDDRSVRTWDVASGAQTREFHGPGQHVPSVAFSPDGSILACGSFGDGVHIWSVVDGHLHANLIGNDAVQTVVFSPTDGNILVSSSNGGALRIWNIARKEIIRILLVETERLEFAGIVFSPDGKLIAVGSFGDGVRIFDAVSGQLKYHARLFMGIEVAFAPDGKSFASSSRSAVGIRNVVDGTLTSAVYTNQRAHALAFEPESSVEKEERKRRRADGKMV